MHKSENRMKFLNTYVDNVTMDEAVYESEKLINNGKYNYIVTPNVDHIVKLEEDKEFKEIYNNADLILTDGMPLIWVSKISRNPIKEKVSGSDFFPKLCGVAARKGYRIFLLGAAEGVAQQAKANLEEKYNGINIVGTYSPKFGFEYDKDEIEKILNLVKNSAPHILAVGLGAPKQEKFIYKYLNELQVPLSLGIGATIDFEAGNIKRAPKWMQKSGLEWFYRFIKEPKRMFKRYFVDDVKFIKIVRKCTK